MCKDTDVHRNAWMVIVALCVSIALFQKKRKKKGKIAVQQGKGNQCECNDIECFLWPALSISGDFVFLLSILDPPAL